MLSGFDSGSIGTVSVTTIPEISGVWNFSIAPSQNRPWVAQHPDLLGSVRAQGLHVREHRAARHDHVVTEDHLLAARRVPVISVTSTTLAE